jgi:tetratricopeptide (TPR) repeat protein
VQTLDTALAVQPNHDAALKLKAEALLQVNDVREAILTMDRYLHGKRKRYQEPGVYRARAHALASVGDYEKAVEDYTHILELEPTDVPARTGRGWAYLALEAPNLALRDFEAVVQLDPQNGEGYDGRGYARARSGQHRQAVQDAETAVRLGPTTPRSLYNAARTYAQAALTAEADPALQNPRGRETRRQYQERGMSLLREALEAVPVGERPSFWSRYVQRDTALNPVRRTPSFLQLAESYSGVAPREKGLKSR